MRLPVYSADTVDWKDIHIKNWASESATEWRQTTKVFSVSGTSDPLQGKDVRLVISQEVLDELRWATSFAQSLDILEQMADEALADLEAGRTTLLNLDDL